MIVNLNIMCKVYVNEIGKQIWLSQINSIDEETRQKHPEIESTIRSMLKEDDSITSELWTIMNVFGPYISMATSPFKITTIEVDKNPNFHPVPTS